MNEWDDESRERRREQRAGRSRPRKKQGRDRLVALGLLVALLSATAFVLLLSMSVLSEGGAEGETTAAGSPSEMAEAESDVGGEEQPEIAASTTTAAPTTTTSLREVVELPVVDVRASSYIEPSAERTYGPDNLVDGDPTTAWNEGAEGLGEGEWVRLHFESPVTPVRLEVANGYQRDQERYTGNGRIEQMTVKYSDGFSQAVELEDRQGFQEVPLEPRDTEWLLLTVESVFPGTTWEDLAVSEIRVYGSRGQLP